MRTFDIGEMTKGWFIGDFEPTAFRTPNCEVAVRSYVSGVKELRHHHKVGTELTYVLKGEIVMANTVVSAGQGIVLEPGESSSFEALQDATLVIVKVPSVAGDKYLD